MTDPAGTLERALERNLLKVEQDDLLPLLDLTVGEVRGYPCNLNEPAFQGVGSVLGGSVHA